MTGNKRKIKHTFAYLLIMLTYSVLLPRSSQC